MNNTQIPLLQPPFSRKIKFLLMFLLASIFAVACSDSSVSPNLPNKPNHEQVSNFQPIEITISGIGSDSLKAEARPAGGLEIMKSSISAPGDDSGSHGSAGGTIQMKSLSNGSFTYGQRSSGGMRYVYATFKVRNADTSGTAYTNGRPNLTYIAANTSDTYGNTAISILRLFNGDLLSGTTAQNIAEQMIPTGQVSLSTASKLISTGPDVLQVFSEAKVNNVTVPSGVTLFPYGFITRSPGVTSGSRTLPANPTSGQYDGRVTFAFKLPLQASASQDPFEITALFLPVDQTTTRITQSPQEQSTDSQTAFQNRINGLNPDSVTILGGSKYPLTSAHTALRCKQIRVAGTNGNITTPLIPASANKISSFSPAIGSPDSKVTITGCDLKGASVTVGGNSATVVSSSSKELVFKVPDNLNSGKKDIEVTNNGKISSAGKFKVSAVVINEFLADPASGSVGDANGDGTRDNHDDEFIEIVNASSQDVDISGWQLSDDGGEHIRYTFPSGTTLQAGKAAVVFGGGTPNGSFGGAIVETAGGLSLNNGGETPTLLDDQDKVISQHTYGSEGGDNQSLTRDPDISGSFVRYTNASGHTGKNFSPGTKVDGNAF